MITDAQFHFDITPKNLAAGVADQISTNVYQAQAAKRLFEGFGQVSPYLVVGYKITAGTGALSFRARLVGADNAGLTTLPEIIADTGVQTLDKDGTALAIGDEVYYALAINGQRSPKLFYGVFYTQGTADQDGEATAVITQGPQTNMPVRKAAVP